jgi:hypothetical protein
MQTFYHGLTSGTRETMDAAARGAFLSLTLPASTALVEKMASNLGMKNVFRPAREVEVYIMDCYLYFTTGKGWL